MVRVSFARGAEASRLSAAERTGAGGDDGSAISFFCAARCIGCGEQGVDCREGLLSLRSAAEGGLRRGVGSGGRAAADWGTGGDVEMIFTARCCWAGRCWSDEYRMW